MKIAQVVCTFPPYKGGIGNSVYNLSKVLVKQGHNITVFTPNYSSPAASRHDGAVLSDSNNFKQIKDGDGFKIIRLKPWIKCGNGAFLPQLLWKLNGFDIIHLHYPFYGAAEIVLLKKIICGKKMKLVIHYHMDSIAKGIKGFVFRLYQFFILPFLIRLSKIITCASLDYVKHSNLAGYYNKHKKKFKQTLFGVDLEQFAAYYNHNKNKKRKEKILLFVGGLDSAHYFKGLENLLKAVKVLKRKLLSNPNGMFGVSIKLNIVGEGNLKPYYKDLAQKLKINKLVNFVGNIDNNRLVDYYNYCDVVVLPSINKGEAFGLVLLEAMACAKPVIASNLPGVRSVFKNGKQGFLAKPDDINDLAAKLKIILQDENLAQKIGQAGRKLVESRYTWSKVGKRLDLVYYYVKYVPK